MPTRLQQARYDGLLRRLGDLKGPGSKVSEVLGDVFPIIDLERLPAELYALAGWRLGFGSTRILNVAGEVGISQIFNPAGSGHLVVPTRIEFTNVSAGSGIIEYDTDSGPLDDLFSTSKPRDTRRGITDAMVAQLRETTQVGTLPGIGQIRILANTVFTWTDLDGLFVLGPGTGLDIGSTVANTELLVNYHWRERVAEPSELNF